MKQSKLESFIEASLNTLSGFILSCLVQWFLLANVFEIEGSLFHAAWTTSLFTVVSLLRSYLWRRFFANELHKKIHMMIRSR